VKLESKEEQRLRVFETGALGLKEAAMISRLKQLMTIRRGFTISNIDYM
jgi:hypothetical protein